MPKLPLFPNCELDAAVVEYLTEFLADTETTRNVVVMEELEQIYYYPERVMPMRLAIFASYELGLFQHGGLHYLLTSWADSPSRWDVPTVLTRPKNKRALMVLQMNEWLLKHALAAGFKPLVPKPNS